jgi:transposase
VLQSLVSSCQINGVDPQAYLTDVLIRIQDHPQSQIDDLLPHLWQPP